MSPDYIPNMLGLPKSIQQSGLRNSIDILTKEDTAFKIGCIPSENLLPAGVSSYGVKLLLSCNRDGTTRKNVAEHIVPNGIFQDVWVSI